VVDSLRRGNTCLVYRYCLIFPAKVCYKSVEDVALAGNDFVLRILYMKDGSCLTSLDHTEDMEEGWLVTIHRFLNVVVQHDLHSPCI